MQSRKLTPFVRFAVVAAAGGAAIFASTGSVPPAVASAVVPAAAPAQSLQAAPAAPAAAAPALSFRAPPAAQAAAARLVQPRAKTRIAFGSDEAVRKLLKFETVRYGGKSIRTLDDASRLLVVRAAAQKAGLHQVGLSYRDVYGVIEAETSWIPRTGMGRNGVASMGLAQFEPRTARGLGLKDPHDPVQAVYFAAVNMKDGAEWAAKKIAHLDLTPEQYQQKLREGVSIYYNLSVKGRNKWNGLNTAQLPVETQRHIRNVRAGAREAQQIAQLISA